MAKQGQAKKKQKEGESVQTKSQGMLFEAFGKIALKNPNVEIVDLYNHFIRRLNDEDAAFASKHFALFLKSAQDARNAPKDVKNEIAR